MGVVNLCKKLFYDNTYIKNFTANIIDIEKRDGLFHIVLDKTAFYPEGGGQPWDQGFINEVAVLKVYNLDGKIFHVTNNLPIGETNLNCIINWSRRFDFMQQHTGQHILSASFDKLYSSKTVGFHLSGDYTTIDVDAPDLSEDDLIKIEQLSNEIVFANLTIKQSYPDCETLKTMNLRKSPSVEDNIRIVSIDGFDNSPCGGTHVDRTGEVGLIKIKKWEKTRGKLRIEFVCGNRAYKDYYKKNNQINFIAQLLSVKDSDVSNFVEKIHNNNNSMNKELNKLKLQLIEFEGKKLYDEALIEGNYKIIYKLFDDKDFNQIRTLGINLSSNPSTLSLLGTYKNKPQFLISKSKDIKDINIKSFVDSLRNEMSISGGGNESICQGGVSTLDDLKTLLNLGLNLLKKSHK